MNLGNASWGFRETPLEEQLKITHDMGLQLLELGIANAPSDLPAEVSDEKIAEVKSLFKKYDISLLCAATGNDFSCGNKEDVPKIKMVIDVCAKLGVKYLRIFAGFSPVGEVVGARWDCMLDALTEVACYAELKKVTLTVETHGGVNGFEDGVEHFYSTSSQPETLCKMLSQLPDTIKVNFDPANLWAVGIKHPEMVYEMIKDSVAVVHLKDFVSLESGHLRPAACGESAMDWKPIMEKMDKSLPMLFEYENTEDVQDGLLKCYEYIKEIVR